MSKEVFDHLAVNQLLRNFSGSGLVKRKLSINATEPSKIQCLHQHGKHNSVGILICTSNLYLFKGHGHWCAFVYKNLETQITVCIGCSFDLVEFWVA